MEREWPLLGSNGIRSRAGGHFKRENSRIRQQIGGFQFCLPVHISPPIGRGRDCWSHAKAQRRKGRTEESLMFTLPAFHLCALTPLREIKAGIHEPQVFLMAFHHPRAIHGIFLPFPHVIVPRPTLTIHRRPQTSAARKGPPPGKSSRQSTPLRLPAVPGTRACR
jgi:hypothetical protein